MGHQVTDVLYGVSSTARGIGRISDIGAALVPPVQQGTGQAPAAQPSGEPLSKKLVKFVPHVVGAGAGYMVWKKHRILGALAGHALLNSGYEYFKGDKTTALCEAAVEGAGIVGALKLFKGRKPVLGWLVGIAAGVAGTYFVNGSPAQRYLNKLRG